MLHFGLMEDPVIDMMVPVSVLGLSRLFSHHSVCPLLFLRKSRNTAAGSVEPSTPLPPELPANEKAPWINIPSSTFADDWAKLINKADHADVTFELGRVSYSAHRYVLCSASDVFRMLLGVSLGGRTKVKSLPQCSGWSKQQLAEVGKEREKGREMEGILAVGER